MFEIQDALKSVKGGVRLASERVFQIPCECDNVYMKETGLVGSKSPNAACFFINQKVSHRTTHPGRTPSIELAKIVIRTNRYTQRIVRESLEILKHPLMKHQVYWQGTILYKPGRWLSPNPRLKPSGAVTQGP